MSSYRLVLSIAVLFSVLQNECQATALVKKIETAKQAKHRHEHAREIPRLRHIHTVVSIFLARIVLQ